MSFLVSETNGTMVMQSNVLFLILVLNCHFVGRVLARIRIMYVRTPKKWIYGPNDTISFTRSMLTLEYTEI